MAGGLAACASESTRSEPTRSGTVPGGTAIVSIDSQDAGTERKVSCVTIGRLTTVSAGDEQAGFTAAVSSGEGLLVQTVSIRNLGGFTGSYNKGLDEPAHVTMVDRTYQLSGIADGFETNNPSFRTPGKFAIQVSC